MAAVMLSAALAASACDNPAKDKSVAVVGAPQTETTASAGVKKLRITPETSKIEFAASKVTGSHTGGFKKFNGTIEGDKPETARIRVEIDTASVYTDTEKLTGHLQSADFFDVAKNPKATFTSTSIARGGAKGATHTVTGNLDLHGVSKSITFPATIAVTPDGGTAKAEFVLNRKDFGIVYAGAPDDLIRDEVVMKLDVRAVP